MAAMTARARGSSLAAGEGGSVISGVSERMRLKRVE